jgi:NAD(P)-dependent dehydrogenase (short-subunit alcohol dehydrogenase family)
MKNKKIFIIGGNGTIGKEIIKVFLDKEYIITVLDIKKIKSKKNFFYEYFDVCDFNNFEKFFVKLIKKYGCPHVLVNCSYPRTDDWNTYNIENLKIDYLRKNVDLHANSYAWSTIRFAKEMKKKNIEGSIILVNSIYGLVAQNEELYKGTNIQINPVYSLIKGGLLTFTKSISSYYGKNNIRINSIVSGGIAGHVIGLQNKQSKNFKKNYIKKTLLKRMGNAKDIANASFFLASNNSSYITGSNLVVDGGFTST